jgi:hypothetical protein
MQTASKLHRENLNIMVVVVVVVTTVVVIQLVLMNHPTLTKPHPKLLNQKLEPPRYYKIKVVPVL